MFRITKVTAGRSEATLKLEGRLVLEWAGAFEAVCREALAEHEHVHLDFAYVQRVDRRGGLALAAVACGRLDIVGCPGFVRSQIEEQLGESSARPTFAANGLNCDNAR